MLKKREGCVCVCVCVCEVKKTSFQMNPKTKVIVKKKANSIGLNYPFLSCVTEPASFAEVKLPDFSTLKFTKCIELNLHLL